MLIIPLEPLTLQISCSSDGSVGLWDPEMRQQRGWFLGHERAVSAVVVVVSRHWRARQVSLGRLRDLDALDTRIIENEMLVPGVEQD